MQLQVTYIWVNFDRIRIKTNFTKIHLVDKDDTSAPDTRFLLPSLGYDSWVIKVGEHKLEFSILAKLQRSQRQGHEFVLSRI